MPPLHTKFIYRIKKGSAPMASKDISTTASNEKTPSPSTPPLKIIPLPEWGDLVPKSWEGLRRMSIKEEGGEN